ncbi:fatty acid biosynthesis transcriptional regulator FasR [Luteococcus sediminum]|uniref:PucR family transcriptional regulator n=1 Tax=Luteococcus sp. TaxID=1969402 RepID=UPI003736A413
MAPRSRNSALPPPAPGTGRALVPSDRARRALVSRLEATTSKMTTATLEAMDQRHPWFGELDAEHRSWITIVARQGIDGFVRWVADDPDVPFEPATVFASAPRALARQISLHQTVDLMRTTISVVEEQVQLLAPRGDRAVLQNAIVHYSREVAFGAAEVYARAAEVRGAWDARMEALVVDAVVRAEADESMVSRASTLGWTSGHKVFVVVGRTHESDADAIEHLRRQARRLGVDVLASVQGERTVVVASSSQVNEESEAIDLVDQLAGYFGAGHVVVGPLVEDLVEAPRSARAATSGWRAADAWPEGARALPAAELLPERVLAGDGHARRELAREVYLPLAEAGGDLLETCVGFLDHGCSVEATARHLFVHANTVRYRIKRIQDVTGYSPSDSRDAYVLRLAITLGRLSGQVS